MCCTIVLHNTPRNSSDYLPSYLQTIITDRSDAVYCLNPITLNPKPSRGGQVSGGKCPKKGRSLGSLTWWRTGSPSHWACYGVRRLGALQLKVRSVRKAASHQGSWRQCETDLMMTHWFSISMSMLRYISSVSAYTCGGFSYVAYIQQSTHNTSATHSLTLSCAFTPHAVQRIQCERSLRNIVLVRGACTKQAATEMVPKARIAARWRPYCVLLVASSGRIDCFCCPMGHRCFFYFCHVFYVFKRFFYFPNVFYF